jgi:hypothetical protein
MNNDIYIDYIKNVLKHQDTKKNLLRFNNKYLNNKNLDNNYLDKFKDNSKKDNSKKEKFLRK